MNLRRGKTSRLMRRLASRGTHYRTTTIVDPVYWHLSWARRLIGENVCWRTLDSTSNKDLIAMPAGNTIAGLDSYRAHARAWLAQHAPRFSGAARRGLTFEDDV